MINEKKIIEVINSVPTLPSVYQNIIRVMSDKNSTVEDIANVISKDQAASLRLLQVANSPLFGASRTIETVSNAIMYLGFIEVRNIVIALAVINLIEKNKKFKNFNPGDFWKHSLAVGAAARMIAKHLGKSSLEKAFLAGILHDIGKLVLLTYFEDEYIKVTKYIEKNKIFLINAEKEILGFTHCEIGNKLLKKWNLSDYLINAVTYHEEGLIKGKFDEVVAVVHLANIYARALNLGNPGDPLIPKPNEKIWQYVKLPSDYFSSNAETFKKLFNQIVRTILK